MTDRHVILNAVVGSQAYGLATANSDHDYLGIYVAPLDDVLGLNTHKVVDNSDHKANRPDGGPDYTLHEVGKYVGLALKCNPSILELLWLDDYEIRTASGQALIDNRTLFLNTPSIVGSYSAYARQQAKRLLERNAEGKEGFSSDVKTRTAKHARHCMRLLLQGAQLLSTGTMQVRLYPSHREQVFDAGKAAEADPMGFYVDYYKPLLTTFDEAAQDSVLPDAPNRDAANSLLVTFRKREAGLIY